MVPRIQAALDDFRTRHIFEQQGGPRQLFSAAVGFRARTKALMIRASICAQVASSDSPPSSRSCFASAARQIRVDSIDSLESGARQLASVGRIRQRVGDAATPSSILRQTSAGILDFNSGDGRVQQNLCCR
jgi:hypothetical protein